MLIYKLKIEIIKITKIIDGRDKTINNLDKNNNVSVNNNKLNNEI